jgi:DNA-binding transcriptional regulator GbsR (MarR family)
VKIVNFVESVNEMCSGAVCVPDSVWFHPQLTATDVKLYKVLLDYAQKVLANPKGKVTLSGRPIITVSQLTLAEKVGVSLRTVQTCLGRLKTVKLIEINHKGIKRNNFIILSDEFYQGQKQTTVKEERRLKIVEKPKAIKRTPIKRVPIKIVTVAVPSNIEKYREKLKELGVVSYSEKAVTDLSKHYDMLASQFNHISGYRSLSRTNPQEHKNWKYFERLTNLCREHSWDAKVYLEAQFDRARKYWKNSKFKFPLPKMLCSEKAQEYFVDYLKDREEKYAQDVNGKERIAGRKTITMRQKLIQDVIYSAKGIALYAKDSRAKALRVFDAWEAYSPAYLWSIPCFIRC